MPLLWRHHDAQRIVLSLHVVRIDKWLQLAARHLIQRLTFKITSIFLLPRSAPSRSRSRVWAMSINVAMIAVALSAMRTDTTVPLQTNFHDGMQIPEHCPRVTHSHPLPGEPYSLTIFLLSTMTLYIFPCVLFGMCLISTHSIELFQ